MLGKLILAQVILLIFQIIFYFGCEGLQHNFHNVKLPVDDRIPFVPITGVTYSLWFPLIAVFPPLVYFASPDWYGIYMVAMVLDIVLSVICYLCYPTTFTRPAPPDTLGGTIMKLIYKGSFRGINCAPSLHCSSCFLIVYISLACDGMPLLIRLAAVLVALAIIVSTTTTKQHTVIDVATGFAMFVLCIVVAHCVAASWCEPLLCWLAAN